jgi:hypothetical protein
LVPTEYRFELPPFGVLNCQRHGEEIVLWLAGLKKETSAVEPSQERAGLFLADVAVMQRVMNSGSKKIG